MKFKILFRMYIFSLITDNLSLITDEMLRGHRLFIERCIDEIKSLG